MIAKLNPDTLTLEAIRLMKLEKQKEAEISGKRLKEHCRQVINPDGDTIHSGRSSLLLPVGSGIAVVEGIRTGIKFIRKIKNLFKRR